MVEPTLPNELVAEILSYFRCDPPTSLDGLQVGLTCKSLYREFQPLIAAFHVERLVEATTPTTKNLQISLKIRIYDSEGRGLLLGPEDFRGRAKEAFARVPPDFLSQRPLGGDPAPESAFPDFEASYRVEPYSLNDTPTVWSLQSLLSRPHIASHLRRFTLRWGIRRQIDRTPTAAWQQALVNLMQVCVSVEGVELVLMGTLSHGEPLIGSPPKLKASTFCSSRLSKLSFEGIALSTFWRPHLVALLTHSTSTLTHLSISSCTSPPGSWEGILSSEWGLHRLEHFEITITEIPFGVVAQFLISSPSISSAVISIPQAPPERGGHTLLIEPGIYPRFLPHLRHLTGTLNFLVALFDTDTSSGYDGPYLILPCLESLTVLYNDRGMSFADVDEVPDYSQLARLLECLPGLSPHVSQRRPNLLNLELHIPYCTALDHWLRSASMADPESLTSQEAVKGVGAWSMKEVARSLVDSAVSPLFPAQRRAPSLSSALRSLSHISSLGLTFFVELDYSAGYPPNYAIHPGSIVTFLSAFPGLKHVVLDGAFYRPENAVRNAEELWEGLGQLWDACPKLERLEVRKIGGSYTPAVWKRGEVEPTPGLDFNDWAAAFLMVI